MIYDIEFKPRALTDLKAIDKSEARHIIEKIELMKVDFTGDVNV
jgi:mRNA-degrading endonuclease RelE of RelBE toxin-antitoxin system